MLATASVLQFSIARAFLQYSCDLSTFCNWSQMRPMAISSLGSYGCSFLAYSRTLIERSTLSSFSQILLRQREESMLLLCLAEEMNCLYAYLRKFRWQQHFPSAAFHHGSSQLLSSVAITASYRHFLRLCSTQKRYWKMRRDFERRWATLRRSTLELSKKFQPYCSSEAVERRRIRPLEVVGTPPLVITLPVLSMPPCLDPAREALVPTLWKPVLSLPPVEGRMIGLAWVLAFLKDVPTRAKRLASSSLIICQAMPSSSVSSSSTQFSLMRHWHLSIQAASSFPFFSSSWSQTWMASAYFRRWQREWARMKSILYSDRQMISRGILGRAWSKIKASPWGSNITNNRMGRRWFSSSKERQEVSQMMNEKIAVMKQTLMKTTPRGFSILFILASVPAFYFINEMLQREYGDPQFVNSSTRFYKYYYLYNMTFFACGMALSRFNFHNPSSKYTIRKTNVTSAVLPFLLSFIGLMIPETDNKHLVWPALVTQIGTLVVQGVMVNKGMLPFWFYSYRHYIGIFYFIMFLINFTAMKRLETRRSTHPHEFVQVQ